MTGEQAYQISVIVPVFNTEKYLPRCLDSLLRQTMPIRIILVDDGSTDSSGEICDRYAGEHPNITVIHKANGGAGSAKNAGIDRAETAFIGFVDSDDWITEDMYEYLLKTQQAYQADVVQIEYVTVAEGKEASKARESEGTVCLENHDSILKRYLADGMKPVKSYSACTKLYRRELFDGVRFPDNQAYDDVVTNYLALSKAKRYVISDRQCYFYFVRNKSITQGKYCLKDRDYIRAGEQIAALTAGEPELEELGKMTLARFHFTCLCKMMKYGCEEGIDWKAQIRTSVPIIRSGRKALIRSGMRKDRIALMLALCMNTNLTIACGKFRIK